MQKQETISVLGICGSPRKNGNSQFLLDEAINAAVEAYGDKIAVEKYSISGKKYSPCLSCFKCVDEKNLGKCIINDDFQELRDLWLLADVIIYSVPVYHLSVPGQLKCFIDRLGNTINRPYAPASPRFLKVVGAISQGTHFCSGQELTINFLIQHAILKNCIPVSGDGWQSYLGACGWTACRREKDALSESFYREDNDSIIAVHASRSLAKRAVELGLIIRTGVVGLRNELSKDDSYRPILEK